MKGDLDKLFAGVRAEVTVPETTRDRHLSAIRQELAAPAAGVSWGVSWFGRHRAALAWLTAGITALPAAAVASQGSLPGDFLYPVKRAIEVVAEPLLPRIEAEHRVDELERLAEAGVAHDIVERAIQAARMAVAETGADDLATRIEEILEEAPDPLVVAPGGDQETATTTTTGPVTTTSIPAAVADDDDDSSTSSTTTTTVEDRDDDHSDEDDSSKDDPTDQKDGDEDDDSGKNDDSKKGDDHDSKKSDDHDGDESDSESSGDGF